ncbi:MAG: hypothetical protein HKN88_00330 [Gammaproteobacteria bacterium]|nr:hypothetical protein [Gammaproteobacteria bacterium]NNC96496.1 hypothetical protein [Gammaproteobacteria bacterium]NNM14720.1 hypothetical protein [Gammaproteobacteria bacterium]
MNAFVFSILSAKLRVRAMLLCVLISSFSTSLQAIEWDTELSAEIRSFLHEPLNPLQANENFSVSLESEFYYDWDDDNQRLLIKPFMRWDSQDSERSHVDLREFYWRKTFSQLDMDLTLGLNKVFWGVTESVHLVDIINQTDGVENLDGEDKLGQPMVNLTLDKDWGVLDVFVLPYFRERTFAGQEGRPGFPLTINLDKALYASGAEKKHVDVALRYSQVFGDWDIGIAHFSGTSREPDLVPTFDLSGASLTPFYDQIEQSSIDLQATLENWLWKLEAITRDAEHSDRYFAFAGGFEYSFYDLGQKGVDLGLIGEYLFDDRKEYASSAFQNDVFLGGRFAFNDENNTDLLAGLAFDMDNQSRFLSIEGSSRIGQDMRVSLEVRLFSVDDTRDILYSVRNDDYFGINLTRFF